LKFCVSTDPLFCGCFVFIAKFLDGTIEINNNAAERSIRPITLGRKNWLFAGSAVAVNGRPASCPLLKPQSSTVSILKPIFGTS
jgi:hypothetical protein